MALRAMLPFQPRGMGAAADPFLTLHREMNRMFDDVLRGGGLAGPGGTAMVPMHLDVTEDQKNIRIIAELPGVSENDIQVELNDDVLTIRGEKKSEYEDAQHHLRERVYGTFSRSIQLPFEVDPNRLEAAFTNGVLTVTVPKEAAQQQSHRIQIKSGAPGQASQAGGSELQGSPGGSGGSEQSAAPKSGGKSASGQGGSKS
jgi:HSP20 family protein